MVELIARALAGEIREVLCLECVLVCDDGGWGYPYECYLRVGPRGTRQTLVYFFDNGVSVIGMGGVGLFWYCDLGFVEDVVGCVRLGVGGG